MAPYIERHQKEGFRMMLKKFAAAAACAVAVFALAACSDDDNNDEATPAPTVTASESPTEDTQGEPFDLVCPPPIGTVQITTDESDEWAPAYVVGTGQALYPVAFGEIVFTDTDTGETNTNSPTERPGVDPTGDAECTFTQIVDDVDENGEAVHGTVTGTVYVVTEEPVAASPTAP